MKNIVCLFVLWLSGLGLYAQSLNLEKVLQASDEALSQVNTLIYKIEKKEKDFSNDTVFYTAVCTLKKIANDPKKGYHILNAQMVTAHDTQYMRLQYDGKMLLREFSTLNTTSEKRVYSVENGDYAPYWNNGYRNLIMYDFFNLPYLMQYNKRQWRSMIKEKRLEEDVYNGVDCYVVLIYGKNSRDIHDIDNVVIKHYIRKSDFLPIAYEFTGNVESITMYEHYSLNYMAINEDVATDLFKIDDEPTPIDKKVIKKDEPLASKEVAIGTIAPAFSTVLNNDSVFSLDAMKGNIVILDFWYRSCLPCLKVIPDLNDIFDKYKARGVMVLGINTIDNQEIVNEHLSYKKVHYLSSFASDDIAKLYGVTSYPTTIIINKNGNVFRVDKGWSRTYKKEITRVLDKLLKE
jgi:peroxiredoxin